MEAVKAGQFGKRLIIHGGTSKNASTAIQSCLQQRARPLSRRGICPLMLSCVIRERFVDELALDECEIIYSPSQRVAKDGWDLACSFGKLYEVYKVMRENRDLQGLRRIGRLLSEKIDSAFGKNNTVVVSAEALETSICLKDPYLMRFLKHLGRKYRTEVIMYIPDVVKHSIDSWLEFGWVGKTALSEWVVGYSRLTTWRAFYKKRGGSYWGNLADFGGWFDYWSGREEFSFNVMFNRVNPLRDFFCGVLGIANSEFVAWNSHLNASDMNRGWPKRFIRTFPLFFDFFGGDYQKLRVIKDLLIEKCGHYQLKTHDDYDYLMYLVNRTLSARLGEGYRRFEREHDISRNSLGCRSISQPEDDVLCEVDALFRDIDHDTARWVVSMLSESLYFLHLRTFEDDDARISGRVATV